MAIDLRFGAIPHEKVSTLVSDFGALQREVMQWLASAGSPHERCLPSGDGDDVGGGTDAVGRGPAGGDVHPIGPEPMVGRPLKFRFPLGTNGRVIGRFISLVLTRRSVAADPASLTLSGEGGEIVVMISVAAQGQLGRAAAVPP